MRSAHGNDDLGSAARVILLLSLASSRPALFSLMGQLGRSANFDAYASSRTCGGVGESIKVWHHQ